MSELRKANSYKAYFLTFANVGWIDVFTRKELFDFIIEKLKIARRDHSILLHSLGSTHCERLDKIMQ